jgi:hypothetical protein
MFQRLVANYGMAKEVDSLSELERQWGLISRSAYAETLERSLTRDYQPRFERCGVSLPAAIAS